MRLDHYSKVLRLTLTHFWLSSLTLDKALVVNKFRFTRYLPTEVRRCKDVAMLFICHMAVAQVQYADVTDRQPAYLPDTSGENTSYYIFVTYRP